MCATVIFSSITVRAFRSLPRDAWIDVCMDGYMEGKMTIIDGYMDKEIDVWIEISPASPKAHLDP